MNRFHPQHSPRLLHRLDVEIDGDRLAVAARHAIIDELKKENCSLYAGDDGYISSGPSCPGAVVATYVPDRLCERVERWAGQRDGRRAMMLTDLNVITVSSA